MKSVDWKMYSKPGKKEVNKIKKTNRNIQDFFSKADIKLATPEDKWCKDTESMDFPEVRECLHRKTVSSGVASNALSKDLEASKAGGVNIDTDLGASDVRHVDIDTDLGASGDGDVDIDTDLGASGNGDVDIDTDSEIDIGSDEEDVAMDEVQACEDHNSKCRLDYHLRTFQDIGRYMNAKESDRSQN